MPRSDFPTEGSHPDLTSTLEQHIRAGFQPDLALDLVLNELVVRAAEATHASSAALALARGDSELVCRAATGNFAPDLGVPLNPRDGLSGVCLRTRQPQLSIDAETDSRVAVAFSRRFGIRSVLVVPVFDVDKANFMGVLEVFSASPSAFSSADQYLLEAYAEECARVCHAAVEFAQPKQVAGIRMPDPFRPAHTTPAVETPGHASHELASTELVPTLLVPRILPAPDEFTSDVLLPEINSGGPLAARRSYETWSLILGTLAILAIIGVSFTIGSRVGWFRSTPSAAPISRSMTAALPPIASVEPAPKKSVEPESARTKSAPVKPSRTESRAEAAPKSTPPAAEAGDLVVYEKGKVVFRMKNPPPQLEMGEQQSEPDSGTPEVDSRLAAASPPKVPQANSAPLRSPLLGPAEAEQRLLNRIDPDYPPAARAAHRAGEVVLEIDVAEDGSVSSIRTLRGDPLLAAAATAAVHSWRYQPYRLHDRPSQFHTDVTLNFVLSK